MSLSPETTQRVSRLAALRVIDWRIDAITPVAPCAVAPAVGQVLADDVTVTVPMPQAALALRDGWAVRSDLVADASPYASVSLGPESAWVEVGDPLPSTADAVLAPDAVVTMPGQSVAQETAAPGECVLPAGADADTGAPLRRAGERLRAIDVAVLRAIGLESVRIREPRVRVASVAANVDESHDFIGPLLVDAVARAGGKPGRARATDTRALEQLLADEAADAVVTIGGTGAGRRDASVNTLARVGCVHIHGMGIRPGESAAFGVVESRPVLMLPGRLDAALAIWLLVGRRLLARLAGSSEIEPSTQAKLARKVVSTIGLAEVIPVGLCDGGVEPLASGYFAWQSLTRAAGWILVPPESEGVPAGATVELYPFP
jgi:molybdopterin molybdotransferase